MTNTNSGTRQLRDLFFNKFRLYPVITYEYVDGYGYNYIIWKKETHGSTNSKMFYKLGATVKNGIFMISMWKLPPSSLELYEPRKRGVI